MPKEVLTYAQLTVVIAETLAAAGHPVTKYAPPILIASCDGIANWNAKPIWRRRSGSYDVDMAAVVRDLRVKFDLSR